MSDELERIISRTADDLMGDQPLATVSRVRVEAVLRRLAHEVRTVTADHERAGLLTVAEVAERMGVAPATVRNWCQHGLLPVHALGVGHRVTWLIPAEALDGFQRPPMGKPRTRRPSG